jgi:2-polyprenyl-3-methyl-5-hydroxy-6-metoxy-1,4-benzoquinol methylase
MKILVVLASYGHNNDQYLARVLREYRSMQYDLDVVVISNVAKDLGNDVEVAVGLPSKNPYSLPFAHKKIFAERLDRYDLFIYSEDDILITERNIDSFVDVTNALPANQIAGFVHAETDADGNLYFDPPHSSFHWDPSSVENRDRFTFAYFTNEHAACFILTQSQLQSAIASGSFVVEPHEGRYELRETAATDPYTQCGFKKVVCISHLDRFTVRHLPANKLAVRPYRANTEFHRQIDALLDLERNGRSRTSLFEPETKVLHRKWSKDYYELPTAEVLSLIPNRVRNVLSIGCAWGAIEGWLVSKGVRVVGIPMDSVIASCAESKGVEIVYGDFEMARQKLREQRFDCVLLSNVLHLVPDPVAVLTSFSDLLSPEGSVVASMPNFANVKIKWQRFKGKDPYKVLGDYCNTGIHVTTRRLIGRWFRQAGLSELRFAFCVIPEKAQFAHRLSFGLADRLLGEELVCVARRHGALQAVPDVESQRDAILV